MWLLRLHWNWIILELVFDFWCSELDFLWSFLMVFTSLNCKSRKIKPVFQFKIRRSQGHAELVKFSSKLEFGLFLFSVYFFIASEIFTTRSLYLIWKAIRQSHTTLFHFHILFASHLLSIFWRKLCICDRRVCMNIRTQKNVINTNTSAYSTYIKISN